MASSGNIRAARNAAKEISQKITKAIKSPAGPKRWFWELLQNAIDSVASDPNRFVTVKVVLRQGDREGGAVMEFHHNGAPFLETKDDLLYADDFENLISPISGKSVRDKNTVGKFGTGFLSTHTLSMTIDVEGVLLTNSQARYKLETRLDRSVYLDDSEDAERARINSIIEGLEEYDKMKIDREAPRSEEDYTIFSYYLDSNGVERVRTGLKEIEQSLPIVFTLNNKVEALIIENRIDDSFYQYSSGEDLQYHDIHVHSTEKKDKNGLLLKRFSIASFKDEKVTLSWPVEDYSGGALKFKNARSIYHSSLKGEMPVLYCTFPLIGSDKILFPVTIHSDYFTPNETRDGISLTKEPKPDSAGEYLDTENRELIERAVEQYEKFLRVVSSESECLYYIANLKKGPKESWINEEWYETMVEKLRVTIQTLPLIDVNDKKSDRKAIVDAEGKAQVLFPSIKYSEEGNQQFYKHCRDLYGEKIPIEVILKDWHNALWRNIEHIKILDIEDVVREVDACKSILGLSERLNCDFEKAIDWLKDLLAFIDSIKEHRLYEEYAILPNQEVIGKFLRKGDEETPKTLRQENTASMIEAPFLNVLLELDSNENWRAFLLHRSFIGLGGVSQPKLGVKDVSEAINALIGKKENNEILLFKDLNKAKRILQTLLSFRDKREGIKSNEKVEELFEINEGLFQQEIPEREVMFSSDFSFTTTTRLMTHLICIRIQELITTIKLSEELSEKEGQGNSFTWLNRFYLFADKYDYTFAYQFRILPDLNGILRSGDNENHPFFKEDLSSKIEPKLLEILAKLNQEKDLRPHILHRRVKTQHTLPSKSLKDHVGPLINELLLQEKSKGDYTLLHNGERALDILQTLLSYQTVNASEGTNREFVFRKSEEIFEAKERTVIPFYQDFKIDNVVKHMIRLINQEIEITKHLDGLSHKLNKPFDETVIWLNDFLNFQIKSEEFKSLINWSNVVPNQYKEFKSHESEEGYSGRIFRPYEISEGSATKFLDQTLIKNLKELSSEKDWQKILVHDGIQLETLPVKRWEELGAEINACVQLIAKKIVEDSEEEKGKYKKPLLELLQWRDKRENKEKVEKYFTVLDDNANKLYLQLTYSDDIVELIKDEAVFNLAKKIQKSPVSAINAEKAINKLEDMQERIGEGAIEEFLNTSEKFISDKETFNHRLETGQNIEKLLREALASEQIGVNPDKSRVGAYDISIYKKSDPSKCLKLEVKSYKNGSSFDFRFAVSQIIEAHDDKSNYIVCSLERPMEGAASLDYLKNNLKIQDHLNTLIAKDDYDKIKMFKVIYEESQNNLLPLEIPCFTDPRVKINKDKVLTNSGDYESLIHIIKSKLTL